MFADGGNRTLCEYSAHFRLGMHEVIVKPVFFGLQCIDAPIAAGQLTSEIQQFVAAIDRLLRGLKPDDESLEELFQRSLSETNGIHA